MKKIFSIILALCLALGVSGCALGGGNNKEKLSSTGEPLMNAENLTEGGYAAEKINPPTEVGRIYALTVYENTLYIVGIKDEQPCIFCRELPTGSWSELPLPSIAGLATIEGFAASDDSLFLIGSRADDTGNIFEIHIVDIAARKYMGSHTFEGVTNAIGKHWLSVGGKLIGNFEFDGINVFSSTGESLMTVNGSIKFIAAVQERLIYLSTLPGGKESALFELDLGTGESRQLCKTKGSYELPYTSRYGVILANDTSAYSVNLANGNITHILDWRDSGAAFTIAPQNLQLLEDGSFIALDRLSGTVFYLRPCDKVEKTVITIGCGQGTYGPYLTQAISEFNMTNRDYTARMEVYAPEDTSKILAQISAGDGPDIIALGSSTNRENAFRSVSIDEALCADLLPYLEGDSEISEEDFVQPVFESMLYDGKLLQLIPSFSVNTMAASSNISDGLSQWDIHSLIELNCSLPQDYALFSCRDRTFLMERLCALSSLRYVDRQAAACSFDEGEFALWLELCKEAKLFDRSVDQGYMVYCGTAEYTMPQIAQRELDGTYSYLGTPTAEEEPVNFFSSSVGGFSILQSSENKDAAWEFLRILLSDELQDSFRLFGYPVMMDALTKCLTDDVKDEERLFSQEDMDAFLALVDRGRGMAQGGMISDIINEEAEKYFSGQTDLNSAVTAIQSRVSIYLSEQYG